MSTEQQKIVNDQLMKTVIIGFFFARHEAQSANRVL